MIEGDLPDGWTGLDIGPDSAAAFAEVVAGAGTVLWNGPLGAFEDPRFAGGTRIVAEAVAHCPGFSVVGGGDSASALEDLGLCDRIGYLSTGGGASLSFIELRGAPPGNRRLAPGSQRAAGVSARRPLVSGNWKMHHDHIEALHTVRDLGPAPEARGRGRASTCRSTRPSPTCAPCRRWWRRSTSRWRWARSTAPTRTPARAPAR